MKKKYCKSIVSIYPISTSHPLLSSPAGGGGEGGMGVGTEGKDQEQARGPFRTPIF